MGAPRQNVASSTSHISGIKIITTILTNFRALLCSLILHALLLQEIDACVFGLFSYQNVHEQLLPTPYFDVCRENKTRFVCRDMPR